MKSKFIFAAALLFSALALSACGGGLYAAKSWITPGGDAVTADWDVASAKCEAEAIDKEASAMEKETAQTIAKAAVETKNTVDALAGAAPIPGLDMLGGAMIGAMPHAMDEGAKNEHFINCMKALGWKQAE